MVFGRDIEVGRETVRGTESFLHKKKRKSFYRCGEHETKSR